MSRKTIFRLLWLIVCLLIFQISNAQTEMVVTLKDKIVKNSTIKVLDVSGLPDGQYTIKLSDKEQINFNVLNKKTVKASTKMLSKE
jgi:hypothetical protein